MMTNQFKAGDRVVCVDDVGSSYELVHGREYVVHSRNNAGLLELEGTGTRFYAARFNLATPDTSVTLNNLSPEEHRAFSLVYAVYKGDQILYQQGHSYIDAAVRHLSKAVNALKRDIHNYTLQSVHVARQKDTERRECEEKIEFYTNKLKQLENEE